MKPTSRDRWGLTFGDRRVDERDLLHDWQCAICGGSLSRAWNGNTWTIVCKRGHEDFTPRDRNERAAFEGQEVLTGLPPELAQTLKGV